VSKFLESIRRAREASAPSFATGAKDPASMTDEERDREIKRLEEEVRRAKIREIHAAREQLGETTPRRRPSPFGRQTRSPWT
jgi:hypothetical protein